MAHPNQQTNGASLEDCHTNFFALTDLCGIRWRKLTSEGYTPPAQGPGPGGVFGQQRNMGQHQPWEYLNDPVLSSYWRCLSNDILCVWRRIPNSSISSPGGQGSSAFPSEFGGDCFPNQPPQQHQQQNSGSSNSLHTLSGAKELWIFWYGDTSPDLNNLVVPELLNQEGEQGSWENGLSYECRSLLFKALHNLIERCLLSRDFIRLGKWFVQPQEVLDHSSNHQVHQREANASIVSSTTCTTPPLGGGTSSHLSFSFSFFVHGESTVCASIDVRQHPAVRRISHRHLSAAQGCTGGVHVLLAPYGLAGVMTGTSYRSSSDHVTRKLMEEWRQYYPVESSGSTAGQTMRGPGPGGGDLFETEDMVEVIVGNVRTRYPSCYVLACDADDAANAAAFNQLAASEGGILMTPPSSPPSNPAALIRTNSHSSSAVPVHPSMHHQSHHPSQQTLPPPQSILPNVPSSMAAALAKASQTAHCWRPEESSRLAEHAWQDGLLSPSGLPNILPALEKESLATGGLPCPSSSTSSPSNLWDFIDPTTKNSCICAKSRRQNKNNGSSLQSSSKTSTILPSSSNNPSVVKRGIPFHLRPVSTPPVPSGPAAGGDPAPTVSENSGHSIASASESVQDRANRPGTTNAGSAPGASQGTPAPTPVLPTYHRSQAALRGAAASQPSANSSGIHNMSGGINSVGPFLTSPASVVAPSPLATPHSHAPPSVPPMDSSLPMASPHPPASNDPSSNFIPSTPSGADQHHLSQEHGSRTTPGGAAHTPGGPKSNAAYSPYVAIPSVDTPGWPHSAGPPVHQQRSNATMPTSNSATNSASTPGHPSGGGATCGPASSSPHVSADLPNLAKKIVLPLKEYEQELREEESNPGLLYDYSSMTAWLFHPVKRMKLKEAPGSNSSDRVALDGLNTSMDQTSGVTTNGRLLNGGQMIEYDGMDTGSYDEENQQSRKRKEPDFKDDDGSINAGTKQVNPSSLFTTEGLQPTYQDLDNIFEDSDESNDTCAVPTPPGSNKPAGLPEDTALMGNRPRIAPAHPSPGGTTVLGNNHLTAGGVNILAPAELSKMFPTPPSHEYPMQSPCGQMEGLVDGVGDMNSNGGLQNGVKSEPGMNGCSPTYLQEDVNKDWSYVYRPPTVWKVSNSAKYAPLPMLPSQTMAPLFLPPPYRPSAPASHPHHHQQHNHHPSMDISPRPMSMMPMRHMFHPRMGPGMVPPGVPHHFQRGPAPPNFNPISPSPYMDGGPPFGGGGGPGMGPHGLSQRPGGGMVGGPGGGNFPPHNTLKQLLQHQQVHPPPSPFPQQGPGQFQHPQQHHLHSQQLQLQMQQHHHHHPGQHPQQNLSSLSGNSHSSLPECHSLTLNIVLADSMLNVFRDHNFDSCAVCVCSDGQNWVGTIRGPDAVFYLPETQSKLSSNAASSTLRSLLPGSQQPFPGMGPGGFMQPPSQSGQPQQQMEEESCRCNCGFSALVNRRLAHQAGLFYEDEVEIAGATATRDPAQFKRGSLYAVCHSDKEDALILKRSRLLDLAHFAASIAERSKAIIKSGNAAEKEAEKRADDMVSSTIAAVVMEASAPSVDNLPIALMELLREQCLLLHHASSPFFRAEQMQAATRKAAILHALELTDCSDTARLALTLALYHNSPSMPPLTSPMHPHQSSHGQQQQWNAGPPTPNPYMPFNPPMGGFNQPGGGGPTGPGNFPGSHPNMLHPMSPSLHSPTMPVRGRPPTPASMGMGGMGGMNSPVGMPPGMQQRPPGMSGPTTPTTAGTLAPNAPTGPVVHYWPFLHVPGPGSSQDVIRVMRILQPLLQDSIQKKRAASLWRAPFAVQGPLTWRQFHRMAVRGTEDRCEPQPIPSVIAGFDRDWVAIAPLAIPHWDRLLLEPFSKPRDIAYIVLAPDSEYFLARTKIYFKELSSVYEMCRLGRHVPITKGLRDGILRVGRNAATKLANDPIDDWFTNIGDSPVAALLRLYAKVCRYHLAPTLINLPMDRTLLDPPAPASTPRPPQQPVPSPMAPPSSTPIHPGDYTNPTMGPPNLMVSSGAFVPSHIPSSQTVDASGKPTSPKAEGADGSMDSTNIHATPDAADDEDSEPPSVVIYIIDPFSFASDSLDLGRLTTLGLLRCYHQMLSLLSETTQLNVSLQLISAESVLQLGKDFNGAPTSDSLRSLALNVFSQCKKLPHLPSNVKSLTGFGPAAASDTFLKAKDEKNRAPYRVYIPPFILAPTKDRTICDLDPSVSTNGGPVSGPASSVVVRPDKFAVLYVSYCLSEDQRWLIAACTDERGELVDSCTIGIDVPNRMKRKRVSVRRYGLQRLMDFILGVISAGIHPWRLVIGRLGRMGHGELKSWSALLSRKNLLRTSRHLAEICGQCSLMFPSQAPTLVSACLVSLEPDSHFRMMPDQVTPDERFGQQSANSNLSTPEDASCTHILVFPTSATTRSPQTTFHEENINGPDLGDDDLLSALNDDMGDGFEGMSGFDDIFMTWPETDPVNDGGDDLTSDITGGGNGGMNNKGGCGASRSPGAAHGGPPSPSGRGGMRSNMPDESQSGMGGSGRQSPRAEQEEVGTLLQQPLALGYYVSTAPTGDMPAWFWASCPHLSKACPAFLKCALHLHNHAVPPSSDDLLPEQQQQQAKAHPLDSQVTTDVLRYVMEGYNALSWLALDPKSRDRRSCLPLHIQLLVQLYHALAALV